jgi:long-chain fatty acid transport protein
VRYDTRPFKRTAITLQQFTKKLVLGLLIIASGRVFASGLSIPLESVAALGEQRAGGAASADDATTNFFNPAGLTRLKHQQLVIAATGVYGRQRFVGTASNPGLTALGFGDGSFNETGSVATDVFSVVPSIHYAYPIADKWAFGLSILTPYALSADYSEDALVRYDLIENKIESIDASPSLAYQVTPQLSIGAGVDLLYLRVVQKVAARTQPLTTQDSMATSDLRDNFARGWHAGLLYQFTPHTRVGLSYRSAIVTHLSGKEELSVPDGPLAGVYTSTNAKATLPLASLTTLSIYHDMTARWAMLGSVEYEGWGIYKNDYAYNTPVIGGGVSNTVTPRDLRNTWFVSLGTRYKLT